MLKGFKDFVMRGNLIELAVAFIVGAAFATVVKTFTDMVMGFIGKVGGQPELRQGDRRRRAAWACSSTP